MHMRWVGLVLVIFLRFHAAAPASVGSGGDGWARMEVPGSWQDAGDERFADHDGFAWYRCYVKVPNNWVAEGERALWANSLTLLMEGVKDAYEVYINGKLVAAGGRFPPNFQSVAGEYHRHKIQQGVWQKGVYNTFAIRVYSRGGQGGFRQAPVIGGYNDEAVLSGEWEFRTGDDQAWATGPLPPESKPEYALFDKYTRAASPLQRPEKLEGGQKLPPKESLALMKVADDLRVDLVLAEPQVAQPLQISFDERGRMWVMEYRQYPYPAGVKIISRDHYYRAVYDKISPPPPNHFRGADRISIHEDSDGDGTYDKHKVFVDGLNIATSAVKGRGGVWVTNPPYLLFYPDRNNDDVPDGPPEVHLEGFGLEDTHSTINSIRFGPDGWLYFAMGNTVTARVKQPGRGELLYSNSSAIWRYHPQERRFEYFAEGGGNNYGLDIDSAGRIYSGYNGGNTRAFHFIQGGYYYKGAINKFGDMSNPYLFGTIPPMAHAKVPRFNHAMLIYEAKALPEPYRGKLLGIDPLHNYIVQTRIERDGSTFKSVDEAFPVASADMGFRPVGIALGPDGGVYIADFYEQFIAHGQHYQGQIDPTTGRVYRVTGKNAPPLKPFDLSTKTTGELIDLLGHDNRWFRQTALRLLGDRADAAAIPRLKQMLAAKDHPQALEALWALNVSGGFNEDIALELLGHANPRVRQWTVRLLGDTPPASSQVAQKLAEMAASEEDAEVRCQLAATSRRLSTEQGLPIVNKLLRVDGDVSDPQIPLMLWYAVEARCAGDSAAVLELFADTSLWNEPIVSQHILERLMRRFAASGTRRDLLACATLLERAATAEQTAALMRGFEEAFKGRAMASLPDELVSAIARSGGESLIIKLRRGDEAAVREALTIVADEKADAEKRVLYVQALGDVKSVQAVEPLLKVISASRVAAVRQAALSALQGLDDAAIGEKVVAMYAQLPADVRMSAEALLTSRAAWLRPFLGAIESGKVGKHLVTPEAIDRMRLIADKEVKSTVERLFALPAAPTTAQMQQQIDRITKLVAGRGGNPYEGQKLFAASCAACHQLWGRGGIVGPDLTSYQRDDLSTLLVSVVNPNAEVREGYESFVVQTRDGRTLSGFLADQDNAVIVLRGMDGQNVAVARDQIEQMTPMGRSLMPTGLLDAMTDDQIRDFMAYLRNSQPIH